MVNRPSMYRPLAQQSRRDQNKEYDERRNKERPWRKWYWTARWRKIAQAQLIAHPLCCMCKNEGKLTPANTCDHVEPHRGDPEKFWCGPFQSLCKAHHDRDKQREERRRG